MRCESIAIPGGTMIVCGRERRPKPLKCQTSACGGRRAQFLCDCAVVVRGRRTVCGRKICNACRIVQPSGLDYCPEHGRQLGLGFR